MPLRFYGETFKTSENIIMIPCICRNSKNKPTQIPEADWVEYNETYRITYVVRVLPQNVLAYSLYEKPLGEHCKPFEYFIATRFTLTWEDAQKVIEMYKELSDPLPESVMQELLENSNLVEQ